MSCQKSSNNDFLEIKLLNPQRKHERLLSIISKNRNSHYQTCEPNSAEMGKGKLDFEANLQKIQIKKLQQISKNADMRQTKFMNSYMDKLKKQRKRQQRRKMHSNIYIRKNYSQARGNQNQNYGENKNNSNSIYIFLPIVSKNSQQQIISSSKNEMSKTKNVKAIATIDLFEGKLTKMRKNRTFSLDERVSKTSRNFEEDCYELKVQEVIQDIKNNRSKASKQQKSQELTGKTNQLDFLLKNNTDQFITDLKSNQLFSENQNNITNIQKKPKKEMSKTNKFMTLNSKDLEPWATSREEEQADRWINSGHHGIQQFYLI